MFAQTKKLKWVLFLEQNNSMDEIPDNLKEFKMTRIILYAAGSRSAKVVSYLEEQGVHAVNVEGGMNAWGDEGTL